jgi:hypothetical protein
MARNHRSFVSGDPRAGRPKGTRNKSTQEIRNLAQRLLTDRTYQKSLKKRLLAGTAGQIEIVLFYFAYGKPVDRVRIAGDEALAIQLAWAEDAREQLRAKLEDMAERLAANVPPALNGQGQPDNPMDAANLMDEGR